MEIKKDLHICKGKTVSDFLIRVKENNNSSWVGSLEHVQSGQNLPFRGYLEMTFLIQEKLETLGYPQSSTEIRSWKGEKTSQYFSNNSSKNNSGKRSENEMRQRDKKAPTPSKGPTFFIRIHYRQNASWQGSIQWLEGNSTKFFRSHLEMIMLMQEAMEKTGSVEAECQFQSWDDQEEAYS